MEDGYREARKNVDLLAQAEYLFYQQRAKHTYFKVVDRNTAFFHSLVKRNNKRREIIAVENSNGEKITKPNEVVQEFIRHFHSQLGIHVEREPFQAECMQFGRVLTAK